MKSAHCDGCSQSAGLFYFFLFLLLCATLLLFCIELLYVMVVVRVCVLVVAPAVAFSLVNISHLQSPPTLCLQLFNLPHSFSFSLFPITFTFISPIKFLLFKQCLDSSLSTFSFLSFPFLLVTRSYTLRVCFL